MHIWVALIRFIKKDVGQCLYSYFIAYIYYIYITHVYMYIYIYTYMQFSRNEKRNKRNTPGYSGLKIRSYDIDKLSM